MPEALANFGVTWGKFVAHIINFLIIYLILNKFAFPPLMKILEERKNRIAETEADREKIKQQLADSEKLTADKIGQANETASRLIAEAKESAVAVAEKEKQQATQEAQGIIAKAREATKLEREQELATLKKDFGRLVIDATGKVTGRVLTKADHDEISKETAAQLVR